MALKWYQDSKGNSSAMRWMAMYAFIAAAAIAGVQAWAAIKCKPAPDLYGLVATFLGVAFGGKVLQKAVPPSGIGSEKTSAGTTSTPS